MGPLVCELWTDILELLFFVSFFEGTLVSRVGVAFYGKLHCIGTKLRMHCWSHLAWEAHDIVTLD